MCNRIVSLILAVFLIPTVSYGTQVAGDATVSGDSQEAGNLAVQKALRAVLDAAVVSLAGSDHMNAFSRDTESRIHAQRTTFITRFSIPFHTDDPYDGKTSRRVLADISMDVLADTLEAMGLVWKDETGKKRPTLEITANLQQFSDDEAEICIREMKVEGIARRVLSRVQKSTGIHIRFLAPGDPWDVARKLAAMSKGRYSVKAVEGGTIDLAYGGDVSRPPDHTRSDAPILEITELWIDQIFPARHAMYASEPCGRVTVVNRAEDVISDLEIDIECPAFLDMTWTIRSKPLPPQATTPIPLIIPFSASRLLDVREDETVPIRVVCRWGSSPRLERKISGMLSVHSKNAVDWDDMMSACAFVTPREETVERITRYASTTISGDHGNVPRSIARSLAITRALQEFDITYVPDPPTSGGAVYDYIQFARETVELKSGDCEDSSVLLGSCLENGDLPVQLLLTPDHVFIAMNTGLFAKDGFRVSPHRDDYVILDDMVWIPLEATLLGKGFFRAWEEGIGTYRDLERQGDYLQRISVREGWDRYPPVNLPESGPIDMTIDISGNDAVDRWISMHRDRCIEREESLRSQINAQTNQYQYHYELGVLLARTGRADAALDMFNSIPVDGPEGFYGVIGSGNSLLLQGDISSAISAFEKASEMRPDDPVPYVNSGVAYLLSGDEIGSVDAFSDALSLLPDESSLIHLLGVELGDGLTKADEAEAENALSKQELRVLMEKVREKKEWKRLASRGPSRHKFAGRKALDPEDKLRAEQLIYWPEISG